jgi:hypothetical protein
MCHQNKLLIKLINLSMDEKTAIFSSEIDSFSEPKMASSTAQAGGNEPALRGEAGIWGTGPKVSRK